MPLNTLYTWRLIHAFYSKQQLYEGPVIYADLTLNNASQLTVTPTEICHWDDRVQYAEMNHNVAMNHRNAEAHEVHALNDTVGR